MSARPTTGSKAYHHGHARGALLQAASDLLETTGAAGLSLRQVAEAAGLSRQAPYNHFADKEALLAELVREGFLRLDAALAGAVRRDTAPVRNLERAAARYIAFAQASPALFRLMFAKELVDLARHAEARAAGGAAFGRLSAIIAAMIEPRGGSRRAVDDLALVAWSLVHGYATLCVEAALEGPSRRRARAALFARTVAASAGVST